MDNLKALAGIPRDVKDADAELGSELGAVWDHLAMIELEGVALLNRSAKAIAGYLGRHPKRVLRVPNLRSRAIRGEAGRGPQA